MCKRVERICQVDPEGWYAPVVGEELVRCKDCKFRNNDGECTQFSAYTSAAGDVFSPHDQFHCGWAEKKETE